MSIDFSGNEFAQPCEHANTTPSTAKSTYIFMDIVKLTCNRRRKPASDCLSDRSIFVLIYFHFISYQLLNICYQIVREFSLTNEAALLHIVLVVSHYVDRLM